MNTEFFFHKNGKRTSLGLLFWDNLKSLYLVICSLIIWYFSPVGAILTGASVILFIFDFINSGYYDCEKDKLQMVIQLLDKSRSEKKGLKVWPQGKTFYLNLTVVPKSVRYRNDPDAHIDIIHLLGRLTSPSLSLSKIFLEENGIFFEGKSLGINIGHSKKDLGKGNEFTLQHLSNFLDSIIGKGHHYTLIPYGLRPEDHQELFDIMK